jgi:hypothetical protein
VEDKTEEIEYMQKYLACLKIMLFCETEIGKLINSNYRLTDMSHGIGTDNWHDITGEIAEIEYMMKEKALLWALKS